MGESGGWEMYKGNCSQSGHERPLRGGGGEKGTKVPTAVMQRSCGRHVLKACEEQTRAQHDLGVERGD